MTKNFRKQLFEKVKWHMGGGRCQKSVQKVSRIIGMAPETLLCTGVTHIFWRLKKTILVIKYLSVHYVQLDHNMWYGLSWHYVLAFNFGQIPSF